MSNYSNPSNPLIQWKFMQVKKANKKSSPVPCFLHSCTQIGSKILVYGGCNSNIEPISQVFVYDTQQFVWTSPSDSCDYQEDHPGMRYGHTATVIDMHPPRILMYGGMVAQNTFEFDAPDGIDSVSSSALSRSFMSRRRKGKSKNIIEEVDDAVYFLQLNSDIWKWSKPSNISRSCRPLGRAEHTACKTATNEVTIFGGWTDRPTNDLWVFDYNDLEWRECVASGIQPKPRYRHTAEVMLGKMVILGGSDNSEDIADGSSNLRIHELSLETMEWSHPELRGGDPFPRSGHGSAVIGAHSIVIFGGKRSEEIFLNDVIILNMETYSFTTVNVIENAVPTAVGNASVSVIGNSVYVFGGTDSKGYCYNDMRSLDITDYLDASDITVAEGSASDYCFKILIIGDASVGKSALLTRFAENTFLPNYTCTIGIDFNSRMIRVDKAICKLEIWDTAGQERFSTITANYYRSAQGALLVYDVGSRSSFEHVKNWYDRAKQLGGEDIEPILIGNKNDISSDERVISFEEGQSLAAELAIPFMETSALNGTNVETAFVEMTSRIKKSVDRKGLIGIKGANMKSGAVALADKDRERSLGERCGCN